jgi:hypothetical protein
VLEMVAPLMQVLAKFERKKFVQIRKYRGATKEGISVKSKISWRNKKWHRGENLKSGSQQKMAAW